MKHKHHLDHASATFPFFLLALNGSVFCFELVCYWIDQSPFVVSHGPNIDHIRNQYFFEQHGNYL